MYTLFSALAVVSFLLVVYMVRRLSPMFGGNSQRLEAILSDDSLAARYRPMGRLLRETDWKYLASQPGFTPSKIRSIRAQRRNVFRRYLGCLSGDFAAICLLVRALMVQSDVPRPDLSKALLRCRMAYGIALLRVEYCLFAHAIGLSGVRIDISGLITALEDIGGQVRNLNSPAAQPALA